MSTFNFGWIKLGSIRLFRKAQALVACSSLFAFFQVAAQDLVLEAGVSRWEYLEPEISVRHNAWLPAVGFDWRAGSIGSGGYAVRFSGRVASGEGDYRGSGSMRGQPITMASASLRLETNEAWPYRVKGLILQFDRVDNDARGLTSDGSRGYRRLNEKLSIGIQFGYDGLQNWKIDGRIHGLLVGRQSSWLSDIGSEFNGLAAVDKRQQRGLGWDIRFCRAFNAWALCPQVAGWHVDRSEVADVRVDGRRYAVYEPLNHSLQLTFTLSRSLK